MDDQPDPGLRELAAKIATSYARANPTSVEMLSAVIRSAYQGLQACALPPPPPAKFGTAAGKAPAHRPARQRV